MRLTWHRQFCQQTTMDSKCQQQQLILNIFGIQGSWKYCPPEKTGAMKKVAQNFQPLTIHSGLEMSRATRKHLWHPKQLEALPTREKGGNEIEIAKKNNNIQWYQNVLQKLPRQLEMLPTSTVLERYGKATISNQQCCQQKEAILLLDCNFFQGGV